MITVQINFNAHRNDMPLLTKICTNKKEVTDFVKNKTDKYYNGKYVIDRVSENHIRFINKSRVELIEVQIFKG